jgi:DNA invertase Pin-like site-specific DNA recombinase
MTDDRKPRVFAYCRASTKQQVESPETQKEMIQKYAVFNNLGDVTFFADRATSGKTAWEDRDAGRELVGRLRKGDHVVITKLDRAFRRLADCVVTLEKFERLGVKLHVVNMLGGAIDLSSPMGRFLIHILAAFAELERAFISERTRDGLAKRKRDRVAHTRFPGYGRRWEKRWVDGRLAKVAVPDDDERAVMRSILGWRTQDEPLSWKEIADHLTHTLRLKTRDGFLWDANRVRRACVAERDLQHLEQRGTDERTG